MEGKSFCAMTPAQQILSHYGLRRTTAREQVLEMFLSSEFALSQGDLEDMLIHFDRVTLYRTLKRFVEQGIIHKIPDDSGSPRYALCHECEPKQHQHQHVHFKCTVCQQTECFEELRTPAIHLPDNYLIEEVSLLVQGICPRCRKQS